MKHTKTEANANSRNAKSYTKREERQNHDKAYPFETRGKQVILFHIVRILKLNIGTVPVQYMEFRG